MGSATQLIWLGGARLAIEAAPSQETLSGERPPAHAQEEPGGGAFAAWKRPNGKNGRWGGSTFKGRGRRRRRREGSAERRAG